MESINPKEYGTATEAARLCGVNRTTLLSAIERGDPVDCVRTIGGSLLIRVASASEWSRQPRKRGPKPRVQA